MFPISSRSTPSGPGSRGGHWHEREFRLDYYRRWRLLHPEYREREIMRARRKRGSAGTGPQVLPAQVPCACLECGCSETVTIVLCGMCQRGLHE